LSHGPELAKPQGFPWGFDGGADQDRTDDLYNAIVALSQLSYGPTLSASQQNQGLGCGAAHI
tara:strand:- start:36140 stop:36325 length:186 start_codon:yes stop_codon:yes gene_type:complete